MDKQLLTLFGAISIPDAGAPAGAAASEVDVFNAEVATLGYSLDAGCLRQLKALSRSGFLDQRDRILVLLVDVTGADRRHQTLFRDFPYRTPEQHTYLFARITGYLENAHGCEPSASRTLSCGHVINLDLFDLDAFGACPICQRQVDELPYEPRAGNTPFERLTPLKLIRHAADAELSAWAGALLARNSSLSADEKDFLRAASGQVPIAMPDVLFKETLPFAYALFGREAVTPHLSGATDILRILVLVSAPENGDLSLASPTRLSLTSGVVKDALAMLDGLEGLAEDLLRHAGRWKIFARDAHVGKASFRRRYPNATAAFDQMMSAPKTIETFGRRIEPLIRGDRNAELSEELKGRPGEFMRRLDLMLRRRTSDDEARKILQDLQDVAPNVTSKLLFEVAKYLRHRDGAVGQRVFLPKGSTTRAKVMPDRRPGLRDADLLSAIAIIGKELHRRFSALETMGKVYLDPALEKVVMPYNRRGDTQSSASVSKGSRYPIAADARALRLFAHWKGDIDLDLSAVTLSERFEAISHVAFNNLKSGDMRHSGDIQSAPNGASEFIDVRLASLERTGARYLAVSLISFRGQPFGTFPAFAGFMERDDLMSGAVYEPMSVALKFALPEGSKSGMPLLFDIRDREVIFADLATGGGVHQAVSDQAGQFQALVSMMVDLPNSKPTALDVLKAHVEARGTLVSDPAEADRVFTRETLDLEDVMRLMA